MEKINVIILTASKGHYLINKDKDCVCYSVQLAPSASADDWSEITTEEGDAIKAEIAAKREEEMNQEHNNE